MKLFVIFALVIAHTHSSPIHELLHPSPVNPDVLVAVKPEEKIILMTDPKEIAKFKRETRQPFYPTVLPETNDHRITKRDHTVSHKPQAEEIAEQTRHYAGKEEHSENQNVSGIRGPLTLPKGEYVPSAEIHKRDIPVPLVPKYHHPEESPKESSEIESDVDITTENLKHNQAHIISKLQTHKRDIPVPLVPKYRHPEEITKDSNEQDNLKSNALKIQQITPSQEQISKEEQQHSKASSKATEEFSEQKKLESSKEVILLHDKKEAKTESIGPKEFTTQHPGLPNDRLASTQATPHVNTLLHSNQNQKISLRHHEHHIKENKKDFGDQTTENTEYHPDIQGARKNEHSHKPVFNENNQKPAIHNDNLNTSDSAKHPIEHHLARPHPVPVAELFARNHDN